MALVGIALGILFLCLAYTTASYLFVNGIAYFASGFNFIFGSVFTADDLLDAILSIGYGLWWISTFIFPLSNSLWELFGDFAMMFM